MDFRVGNPRVCLVESGWAETTSAGELGEAKPLEDRFQRLELLAAGGGGAGWGCIWPSRFSSLSRHCEEAVPAAPPLPTPAVVFLKDLADQQKDLYRTSPVGIAVGLDWGAG